ncbi:toll/interleukin-1 receptor domain-containing protein [Heyndrickxia oleronia]|jgi:hypothetical protein|uniref:toll/interleukin-1 receptor domain-containing protein n=1 Tax=Heyndrickxia oleronia TaxID=38875 RepID=UPI003750BBFB
MEQKTAFISYSWDSEEHKQWVMDLANALRKNGVEANIDRFLTQTSTVNLNTMMITNMKKNDFVIVVLTETFAEKADDFKGGVGFETILSLPILQENPEKLIFILRHKGNFANAFPFHLKGYYAIDFSNDSSFEESFQELLHRIYGVPLYEMEPIGAAPQLKPRSNNVNRPSSVFTDIELPNLKRITDQDKLKFMKNSYEEMKRLFEELFEAIKSANSNFDYSLEEQTSAKVSFHLFVDGRTVSGVSMWIENSFGHSHINLRYGNSWGSFSDNSYNESISCEVGNNKELKLKMQMNMMGNNSTETPEQIVKEIWKNNLSRHFN